MSPPHGSERDDEVPGPRGGPAHTHESEHARDPRSGVLRAAVFGAPDGLVSNLALVMGVAGGSGDASVVVLAGVAGLLAGAFSMAAGEYISMQTQREMLERELEVERKHIEDHPEAEQRHLAELLAENGIDEEDASRVAAQAHERTDRALEFHAQLELGIQPSSLGAPGAAALSSFGAFALGAAVPLLPWLVTRDALLATMLVSGLALLWVGAAATRFTQRSARYGAVRQLLVGALSAAVTFGVGSLISRL